MQDRFKFRAWDKNAKIMIKPLYIEITHCKKRLDEIFDDNRLIFMQCTGLKDSAGHLIYEGDIVKFYSLYGYAILEIKWNEEFATFGYEDEETDFSELGRLYDEASFVEVIGNIYENKELIKEILNGTK